MAQSKLQILIDVVTGGSERKVDELSFSLSDLAKTGAIVGGTLTTVGIAAKQAFELGREVAQLEQTAESFDLLLSKVGAAPGLFQKLKQAAGGTISDFELMSSTATLLAGASGDLGAALANATPQLLEIARAAQKLNPTLGDTQFLYDSIATGIKRASPLILDNLGLTISVADANRDYANALGKSVEELTEAERAMALLNATLEAGDVLINQVGGSVESATDKYTRLAVKWEELSQKGKGLLAPAIEEVIDVLTINLRQAEMASQGFGVLAQWNIVTAESFDKTKKAAADLAPKMSELTQTVGAYFERAHEAAEATEATKIALIGLTEAELGRQAIADLNAELDDRGGVLPGYEEAARQIMVEMLGMSPAAAEATAKVAELRYEFINNDGPIQGYLDGLDGILDRLERISEFGTLTLPTVPEGAGFVPGGGGGTTVPVVPRQPAIPMGNP